MPHLHLSLQAGDNLILKRMKRRHSREQAIELCLHLRRLRPDVVFGADLMVGFPTETHEMYLKTKDLIEECGLHYLHVFPFSARSGTAAARIAKQVDVGERQSRAAELRRLGQQRVLDLYQGMVGSVQSVLIETETMGRTPQFAPVRLQATAQELGQIRPMLISEAHPGGVVVAPVHTRSAQALRTRDAVV